MFEALTTEVIVGSTIVGTSALAMIVSFVFTRAPREKPTDIDVEALVRDAPYHLLDNILPVEKSVQLGSAKDRKNPITPTDRQASRA